MTLIAVAGGKGAAGITTTATALAAVWPQPAALADCDPHGGDLALRLHRADGSRLARNRGVVGLAAAARMNPGALDVESQLQEAAGGLPVIVGVDSPTQATHIGSTWAAIANSLAEYGAMDVVADCGRILPGLPSEHLLRRAELTLLVTRATPESVVHLRAALEAVRSLPEMASRRIYVVVLAEMAAMQDGIEQVRAVVSTTDALCDVIGGVALDAAAASGLAGAPTRGLDRSSLVSSARDIAGECYRLAHERRAHVPARTVAASEPVVEVG